MVQPARDMPSSAIVVEPRATDGADVAPATAPVKRPRRLVKVAGWVLAGLMLWCAWAVYAVYDLSTALDNEDAVALGRRIDWVAVRDGLREELTAKLTAPPPGAQVIEGMLSTRSIVGLLRAARVDHRGWEGAQAGPGEGRRDTGFRWLRVRYAFFSGGPFAVRVDVRPDSDSVKQPLVLLFRWSGDWQLSRVFLPADFGNARPAEPAAAAAPAAAPLPSAPAGIPTQRAVLYEEDAADPQGKKYDGTVTWRTEPIAAADGRPADVEVKAYVDVPAKPMRAVVAIRRNSDRSLPASHLIDLKIEVPPDSATGGIENVPGMLLKATEAGRGTGLSGIAVRVSEGYFMIGLSAVEMDRNLNMELLKNRPWIEVPIQYKNKIRAILELEKGESGTNSVAEALARWSTPPGGEAEPPKN